MPVILPPPQYDHPYEHRMIVETVPYFEVQGGCRSHPPNGRYEACSWTFTDSAGKPVCHIIYPRLQDVGEDDMVRLVRHETAHCNGWSKDHEGGFYGAP